MLTRKLRHASSFSLECTNFKNVTFEKIPWAPSEVTEVAEVKQPQNPKQRKSKWKLVKTRWNPKFDLGDLSNLRRGSGNFFKSYIFEINAFQGKRWGMFRLFRQNLHWISPQRRCEYTNYVNPYQDTQNWIQIRWHRSGITQIWAILSLWLVLGHLLLNGIRTIQKFKLDSLWMWYCIFYFHLTDITTNRILMTSSSVTTQIQ